MAPGVELGVGYEPVYAPALVAFLGDADGLAVGFDGPVVGWVPLGPGEFWHPWYRASYHYWRRANLTNVSRTAIDTVTIDNYRTVAAGQTLANRRAARLVPRQVFAGGQPVQRAGLPLRPDALNQPLHQAAAMTLPVAEAGARAGGAAQATSVPAAPVPRMAHAAPAGAAVQPRIIAGASPIYHPSSMAAAPVQTPPPRSAPERGVSQPAQQRAPAPPQSRPRAEAQKPQR